MYQPVKVWETKHDLGDVKIASFAFLNDAILFAQAKASRDGGFVSTILIGENILTRKPLSDYIDDVFV